MAAMIADLMFPRGCAGCDCPDAVLCVECRKLFHQHVERSLPSVVMDRWFACGWYRGSVRRAILSWKDHGDEECDGPLCEMLHDLARSCGLIDLLRGGVPYDGPILIIPAPSSRHSVRQRGRRHMMQLSKRLARDVRGTGLQRIGKQRGNTQVGADARRRSAFPAIEGPCCRPIGNRCTWRARCVD